MSVVFWIKLSLSVFSLCISLMAIRSYKQGALRRWRARGLRRRLSPLIENMLYGLSKPDSLSPPNDLPFLRQREEIEVLFRRSSALLSEERKALAEFLRLLSKIVTPAHEPKPSELESAILKGQRLLQDMREFGF